VVARSKENFNLYSFIHLDVHLDIDWGSVDGCLPCLRAGKGMPRFCRVIWIGAVVGAGHACAMVVRVVSAIPSPCFFLSNNSL
jgi:hypothetical protein